MPALVDSHLFRLELSQWKALCSLFPAELQPIAEGRAPADGRGSVSAGRITPAASSVSF